MDCEVKFRCANNYIGGCTAAMKHCNNNFDPEVQIEHNHHSARFTCTDNNNCDVVSPTTCDPETTTTTMTTVVNSMPYCETTHTTTPSLVTGHTSPTMCTPATITTTVTTSVPYCETTHTTHSCEITSTLCKSPLTNLLVMPQCACVETIW